MSNLTQHRNASRPISDDDPPILGAILSPSTENEEGEEDEESRSITPIIKRVASIRLPHDHSEKELAELAPMLEIDLRDNIVDAIPDLFDVLFPNEKLPFPINQELLNKLPSTLYDSESYLWNLDTARTESTFCTFMNSLCSSISNITGVSTKRCWDAKYRNTPLAESPIKRKPDIVLKDVGNSTVTWRTVRAIAEITAQQYEIRKMVRTVIDKSYIVLTTQASRVFVPILSVWGSHLFRLTVTDREGQLRSVTYQLSGIRPVSSSLAFLRLIAGLCFSDAQYVGYDPTMKIDSLGRVKSIRCCDQSFKVIRTIYETQSFVGRATRVWEVEHGGKQFILKDAWVEKSRPVSENQHLKHIAGVNGVPEYICGEDVSVDGKVLSTGDIRGFQLPTSRLRRRIVTSSIGSHIAEFRSKRELISVFRDIVTTLKELATKKDTVHRDISYSNILILDVEDVEDESTSSSTRRGLLIDFEYAARISESYAMSPGLRTGTLPFMSIQLLISPIPVFHTPSHDLESIFFVFIYLCSNLSGPGVPRPLLELQALRSLPIASWFNPACSMERLGADKISAMMLIRQRILPYFAEYFNDLKPCAIRLYDTIYPTHSSLLHPKEILHDEIIKIFNDVLETLPEVDPPASSGGTRWSRQRKRSLGMHDNTLDFNRLNKKKKPSANISNSGIRSSTGGSTQKKPPTNPSNSGIHSSTGRSTRSAGSQSLSSSRM